MLFEQALASQASSNRGVSPAPSPAQVLFEQALAMEEDNGDSLMAYALFLEERLKDFAAAEQMYV